MRERIRIVDEETMQADRPGIETPRGTKVVAHGDGQLVLKVPGHHYYGGLGRPQLYAGAEFMLYTDVREVGDGLLEGRVSLRWPVRS